MISQETIIITNLSQIVETYFQVALKFRLEKIISDQVGNKNMSTTSSQQKFHDMQDSRKNFDCNKGIFKQLTISGVNSENIPKIIEVMENPKAKHNDLKNKSTFDHIDWVGEIK